MNSTGIDGENGPALAARFNQPNRLAVAPDGTLYIADEGNNRVRTVTPPLPGLSEVGDTLIASPDGSELYVFNPRGRHERTVDTLARDDQGNPIVIWEFNYDDAETGFLTSVTDRDGNVTTFERGVAGGDLVISGPFGQQTVITLDANGYVQSIANPGGEATSFQYTPDGLMTKVTDPRGNDTDYGYTAEGRLESTADPVGGGHTLTRTNIPGGFDVLAETAEGVQTAYRVEFQSTGDLLRSTLEAGVAEKSTVVFADRSAQTSWPDGLVVSGAVGGDPRFGLASAVGESATYTFNTMAPLEISSSRTATLASPLDPLSLQTQNQSVASGSASASRSFDTASNTYTETSPEGRVETVTVDGNNSPVTHSFGGLASTTFSYDAQGRLESVSRGSRTSTLEYDTNGRISRVTDPLLESIGLEYNASGNLVSQTLADLSVVSFSHDAAGNITSLTPPGRMPHQMTYDQRGRLSVHEPPNTTPPLPEHRTSFAYNSDGQLTTITRPDSTGVSFAYHPVTGQPTTVTLPSGQIIYQYDLASGALDKATSPSGVEIDYSFDTALPTGESWSIPIPGLLPPMAAGVSRTYDELLRVASETVTGTPSIALTYDDDTNLTGAGDLVLQRYAASGLLQATQLGVTTDTLSYDALGARTDYVLNVNGAVALDVHIDRDLIGRIHTITEVVGGSSTDFTYEYDSRGRLTDVLENGAPVAHYDYDQNNNRTSGFDRRGALSGAFDEQDRQISATKGGDSYTYQYSAAGELSSEIGPAGTTAFEYDPLGNLLSVDLPDGTEIEYLIDSQSRRVGRIIDGVFDKGFIYNGQSSPVAELDFSGNVVSRFVYGDRTTGAAYMLRYDSSGTEIGRYRIVSDQLGSVRLVVDTSTGAILQQMSYDEFGRVLQDTNPGFQPFGFAAGLYDPLTGLVRFGARDYDPKLGRWTAKDPLLLASPNVYEYVGNDPVNRVDPLGLISIGTINENQFSQQFQAILNGSRQGIYNLVREVRGEVVCFAIEEVIDEVANYGIYILLNGAGIPYVGRSENIEGRIGAHKKTLEGGLKDWGARLKFLGDGLELRQAEQFILDFVKEQQGIEMNASLREKRRPIVNRRNEIRKFVGKLDFCD